ncbi:alanine racemase [Clostridiales bacterium F-3ap]|uniref:Alanine racemase n=2 Tax=Anaerotalea alkaliphila TaxID=2662126 RepID=A0A7X5HT24_9FIRM|nr:alanine racemase [Anaerotalea alkaliphila]
MEIVVDLDRIGENVEVLRKHLKDPGTRFMAVVKCDAYGHGMVPVARAVQDRVDCFGVGTLEEGVALRQAGIVKPVLVLGPVEDYRTLQGAGLQATIGSWSALELLESQLEGADAPLEVHLKVDTGMHRFGFQPREMEKVLEAVGRQPKVQVRGVYSHFGGTFPKGEARVRRQFAVFSEVEARWRKELEEGVLFHMANSENALDFPASQLDMVRIGNGLFGPCNSRTRAGLSKAARVYGRIVGFQTVEAGECAGYGLSYRVKRPTTLAVLDGGIYEGVGLERGTEGVSGLPGLVQSLKKVLRKLLGRTNLVGGKEGLRVAGPVQMQFTLVDLGLPEEKAFRRFKLGDAVEIRQAPLYLKESVRRIYSKEEE